MAPSITIRDLELFLPREQIHRRIDQIGTAINRDFQGQSLLLLGVLKGAAMFLSDLARAITLDSTFDFVSVSSYGASSRSSGTVRLVKDADQPLENRIVILVEDIVDTGVTLRYLKNHLLAQRPAALKIVTLLDKPSRRLQAIEPDYIGFTVPNRFVVGYGMDLAERFRNLPDIYFVPPNIQEE
ncbi:MAG: hypoxanthine phosphoribosyltransferase [Acidobacteriaceae bacterium]